MKRIKTKTLICKGGKDYDRYISCYSSSVTFDRRSTGKVATIARAYSTYTKGDSGKKSKQAPKLYNLSSLQAKLNKKYKYSGSRTVARCSRKAREH